MKVGLSDRIRMPNGEVGTLAEFVARGEVTFSKSDAMQFSGRGKPRKAYFADFTNGYCVEISKRTFDSCVEKVS